MAYHVVSIISRMNVGGPAVLLSELIRALPPEEFEHTLITGTCLDNEIDYLESHALETEVIYIDDIQRSILLLADIKSFLKLIKILRRLKPDIVHTHTSKAGVLGRLAAKVAVPHARIIHTYHGHLLFGYFPKWKTRLIVTLERVLAKFSNKLIAVAVQVQRDLYSIGVGAIHQWVMIRPGVTPQNPVSPEVARDYLNIDRGKLVIAWIGRFTQIKDPLRAVKSIGSLPLTVQKDIILVMAGSGELMPECKQYVRENNLPIIFTGWVENPRTVICAASILLMTSKNEGMPVVIVESALLGVPTASTNVGGVSEFIKDKTTGWLLSNPETDLVEVIKIATSPSKMKSIKNAALRLAESEYSVEGMIKKHVDLYREVLK